MWYLKFLDWIKNQANWSYIDDMNYFDGMN